MTDRTTVTQTDRDAAAGFLRSCPAIAERVINGEQDDHGYVQAFARHRIESQSSPTADDLNAVSFARLWGNYCDVKSERDDLRDQLAALSRVADDRAAVEALTLIADLPDPGAEKERSATFYRVHAAMLKQVAAKALGRETVSQEAFDWAEQWTNSDEGRAALAAIRAPSTPSTRTQDDE